jgi:hypothetical protein
MSADDVRERPRLKKFLRVLLWFADNSLVRESAKTGFRALLRVIRSKVV